MEQEFLEMPEVKQAVADYMRDTDKGRLKSFLQSAYKAQYKKRLKAKEINDYIKSLGKGEEIETVAQLRALRDAITRKTVFKGIQFDVQDLTNPSFNIDAVRLTKTKASYDLDKMRQVADEIIGDYDFEGVDTLKRNLESLYAKIEGDKPTKKLVNLPFDEFFGGLASQTEDFSKTYQYWARLEYKVDNLKQAEKAFIEEARKYISETKDFDREFDRALSRLEAIPKDGLQYIETIPTSKFQLKDLDERIDDLIDYFLREYQYENLADEREIQNAGNSEFDPLTARYIIKNKKVVITQQEIKNARRQIREDLTDNNVEDSDVNALVDEYVKSIEIIESQDRDMYKLPIFIVEQLGRFAPPSLVGMSNKINENIERYLEALADVIEDKKTLFTVFEEISPITSQERKDVRERRVKQIDREAGVGAIPSVRSGSVGTKRQIAELEDVLFNYLDAVNEHFIKPLSESNRHLRGIEVPFARKLLRIEQYLGTVQDGQFVGGFAQSVQSRIVRSKGRLLDEEDFKTINSFFDTLKEKSVSFENIKDEATELYKLIIEKTSRADKTKIKENLASLLGSISKRRGENPNQSFMGINVQQAYSEYNVDDPREMFYIRNFLEQIYRNRSAFSRANRKKEVDKFVENYQRIAKNEFNSKLLEVHDSLRIMKSQDVYVGFRNLGNHDDVIKTVMDMENDGIDISALDVESIVKSDDAYGNISTEYGISFDKVYEIKAMFR